MHWTAVQKTTGVLLAVVVPTTVIVTWNVISGWEAGENAGPPGQPGKPRPDGRHGWMALAHPPRLRPFGSGAEERPVAGAPARHGSESVQVSAEWAGR